MKREITLRISEKSCPTERAKVHNEIIETFLCGLVGFVVGFETTDPAEQLLLPTERAKATKKSLKPSLAAWWTLWDLNWLWSALKDKSRGAPLTSQKQFKK